MSPTENTIKQESHKIKFTEDHEWVSVKGNEATVGITDYAQKQLGDIVFVEGPKLGSSVKSGDEAGVVESVKAASEIYTPLSGTILIVNKDLEDNPSLLNSAPETDGWIFKLTDINPEDLHNLMDLSSYETFLETLK